VLPGSGDPCQYSVSTNAVAFPAFGGGSAPVQVATGDNCAWSAVPTGPGVTVSSPAGGLGNGAFILISNMPQNVTPNPVVGAQVVVQNQAIAVTQDPALVAAGNDDVASPFSMGALPAVVIEDATGATESPADPVHSCTSSADFKTLWYTLTAPSAGTLSLTFYGRQGALLADSGIVVTMYPVVNGAVGAESNCRVIPQNAANANIYHPMAITRSVQAGDTFLVEISATLSGAPNGAQIIGGNLVLTAIVR